MKIEKYNVTVFTFEQNEVGDTNNLHIIDIIYSAVKEKLVYLFEYKPQKYSLIYDLSNDYLEVKKFGEKYLYTSKPTTLTKEDLTMIVEDSSFYLGHLAIILSDLNENSLSSLIMSWRKEFSLAGVKMVRMDFDGLCVLFYNMEKVLDKFCSGS